MLDQHHLKEIRNNMVILWSNSINKGIFTL